MALRSVSTPNQSSRSGAKPKYIVHHHMASTGFEGVLESWRTGRKQGSCHVAISNTGERVRVVGDNLRAWSLSSAKFDGMALVTEIANESMGGSWPVSDAAHEAAAQQTAEWSAQYGIPLTREYVIDHGEVFTRHRMSYPTACAGGLDMDRVVARAVQIRDGIVGAVLAAVSSAPAAVSAAASGGGSWAAHLPNNAGQRRVQAGLAGRRPSRYTGPVDGVFGINTWKGVQKSLVGVGYTGPIDGIPGANTCRLVQVYAQRFGDYTGPVDSILGPNSWAGFALGLERP